VKEIMGNREQDPSWTMAKLERLAKRIAADKMSWVDVKYALIAQYGPPSR
jgi:hypothetical protein